MKSMFAILALVACAVASPVANPAADADSNAESDPGLVYYSAWPHLYPYTYGYYGYPGYHLIRKRSADGDAESAAAPAPVGAADAKSDPHLLLRPYAYTYPYYAYPYYPYSYVIG